MRFVFLDEFGHIGPFISRSHPQYKTSPVFGLAGMILPEDTIRHFSTWYFQLKEAAFATEIAVSSRHPSAWEKKGHEVFTSGKVYKTKRLMYSVLNEINRCGGKVFYHGIEKYETPEASNAIGLYSTVLTHALHNLDRYAEYRNDNFVVILDEHTARVTLLESAMRAMFGQEPVRRLVQPPFQVESHLYQTVQTADWIASIVGPLWAHRAMPSEFGKEQWAEKYFAKRLDAVVTHSSVRLKG